MTEPEAEVTEYRDVEFRGRTMAMKQMNSAQLALLSREARLLERDDVDKKRKMVGAARMFDAIESMVVNPEDQVWFSDLVAGGSADLLELINLIKAFRADEEPKPKVRRGRPPRAISR